MHTLATVLLAVGLTAWVDPDAKPTPPLAIGRCIKSPQAKGLRIDFSTNPFYLRGDFDGDGKPDYAVRVFAERRPRDHAEGLLVCTGSGSVILLGVNISGRKFSDMSNDNFFAPEWEVFTREGARESLKASHTVPNPAPDPKGEAIAMVWEDGCPLIYWDGRQFVWVQLEL